MLRPPTARAFRLSLFSNQYLKSLVAANRRRRLLRGSDIVSVYRQVLDRDARRLVDPSSHGVLLARVAAANHWPTTHSYCTSTADSLGRRSRETATTTFCRRSVPPGILLLDITVSYTLYLTSTVSFQNECLIFTREIGKTQSEAIRYHCFVCGGEIAQKLNRKFTVVDFVICDAIYGLRCLQLMHRSNNDLQRIGEH